MPTRRAGLTPPERRRVAERYLGTAGLAEHVHEYPRELSGRMKQRVAIARTVERLVKEEVLKTGLV